MVKSGEKGCGVQFVVGLGTLPSVSAFVKQHLFQCVHVVG
jgi:hypothetical protein